VFERLVEAVGYPAVMVGPPLRTPVQIVLVRVIILIFRITYHEFYLPRRIRRLAFSGIQVDAGIALSNQTSIFPSVPALGQNVLDCPLSEFDLDRVRRLVLQHVTTRPTWASLSSDS
jgi:hypothetical protein